MEKKKTLSWREKLLSKTGKLVMIRVVQQSLPTYVMSCLRLSHIVCTHLTQCISQFWWKSDYIDQLKKCISVWINSPSFVDKRVDSSWLWFESRGWAKYWYMEGQLVAWPYMHISNPSALLNQLGISLKFQSWLIQIWHGTWISLSILFIPLMLREFFKSLCHLFQLMISLFSVKKACWFSQQLTNNDYPTTSCNLTLKPF